jgi:hypothetical protein
MEQTFDLVENLLLKRQHRFTDYEASRLTGVAIEHVKDALEELMQKYICRLQVTENGELIYDFGARPRRRGEKTAAEILAVVTDRLWKVFTVLFKIWLTVTLVVYFVIFVILIILLLAASSSRGRGKGGAPNLGRSINGARLAHVLFSIFRWRTITGDMRYRRDNLGYSYREYQPRPGVLREEKKNLVASVYDFVFGPPRVEISPLQNAREVAAFLSRSKGILVSADLEALAGINSDQADHDFTEYLTRYDGEVLVSENGAVYGKFERILKGVEQDEGKIVYYWDEYEPEHRTTGNSAGRNFFLVVMNAFNLLMSFFVTQGALSELGQLEVGGGAGELILAVANHPVLFGGIPFVFSLLFFIIPGIRWLKIRRLREQRHKNNIRKRLYKVIFDNSPVPQTVESINSKVNGPGEEEILTSETISDIMQELVLDLDGETDVSEEGKIQYQFSRIRLEQEEASRLRTHGRIDRDLGDVVFDTDQ